MHLCMNQKFNIQWNTLPYKDVTINKNQGHGVRMYGSVGAMFDKNSDQWRGGECPNCGSTEIEEFSNWVIQSLKWMRKCAELHIRLR
ncbi:hypothetical protein FGO68_gene1106 [Halteria grandinella]|uniref:Uncharacterized protein n=1 Tax=Halteria grandinella TaxID=5974 RepID=A0A8J8P8I9_HALGN|nr:hypothetical protein FGO68_gene1106 [Halteria grandinella]